MRRRALLAALGTGTLVSLGSYMAVTRRGGTPSITVDADPIPPGEPYTVRARVVDQYSAEQPPRIALELRNESDEALAPTFGSTPPFSTFASEDGLYRLLPLDRDNVGTSPVENPESSSWSPIDLDDPVEGCWRSGDVIALGTNVGIRLRPGESVAGEYLLAQSGTEGDCFPAGTARFVDDNYRPIGTSWGLKVRISSP